MKMKSVNRRLGVLMNTRQLCGLALGAAIAFVAGGGQDFVRVYSEQTYGIPPEQVAGSMAGTKYGRE